jgi:hypothetical protein
MLTMKFKCVNILFVAADGDKEKIKKFKKVLDKMKSL